MTWVCLTCERAELDLNQLSAFRSGCECVVNLYSDDEWLAFE